MAWNKSRWLKLLILVLALAAYGFAISKNADESSYRSSQLRDDTTAADRVLILVKITQVDPSALHLQAQLGFRLAGTIAQDEVTPKIDLKLLMNNAGGQQEFSFPKGKRMHRIEATFPLDGDLNKYPFDRYATALSFLVTTPKPSIRPSTPDVAQERTKKHPASQQTPEDVSNAGGLTVGKTILEENATVPLSISMAASVPEIKFIGSMQRQADSELKEILLGLSRPSNLIHTSITVMILMLSLAFSVLGMAIKSISKRDKFDFLPLSLALTLIFGLPALRNIQPGIPHIGALGDYFAFIWAEMLVASSAIIIMLTWLLRSD